MSQTSESALAKLMPTHSAGARPGPTVTAMASIFGFFSFEISAMNPSTISCSFSSSARTFFSSLSGAGFACLKSFASLSVSRKSGTMFLECSRLAIMGKTPPYWVWRAICEATLCASMMNFGFALPVTDRMASAVSSQDVSTERILIGFVYMPFTTRIFAPMAFRRSAISSYPRVME